MSHTDDARKLCAELGEQRLAKGTAVAAVVIRLASDAELGAARREQLKEFGERRGADIHAERKIEHTRWNQAAAVEWCKDPTLKKVTVAGIVKRELKLAESISAIRHVIKKPGK
jgi:hypothetical protein